jgi:hypothetical protein
MKRVFLWIWSEEEIKKESARKTTVCLLNNAASEKVS